MPCRFCARAEGGISPASEADNCCQVFPVEEEGYQRYECPFFACQRPAERGYQAAEEQYRYGKPEQGHHGGFCRVVVSGARCYDSGNSQNECGNYQYQMNEAFNGGFSHGRLEVGYFITALIGFPSMKAFTLSSMICMRRSRAAALAQAMCGVM